MAMLSRVADSLFWMGRYLERAEQIARQLEVARDLLVDLTESNPQGARAEWNRMLESLAVPNLAIERLVFDVTEISSLAGCIGHARENARQVREVIANEMWEQINRAYWSLVESRDGVQDETAISKMLSDTVTAVASWNGLTDSCMDRGPAWTFLKLGKWVERLYRTGQVVLVRTMPEAVTQDNVALIVLLKGLGAVEAYRKVNPMGIDLRGCLDFVLFKANFPRSLRYCATEAEALASALECECRSQDVAVGRAFGRLASTLVHADVDEALEIGVVEFVTSVLNETTRASAILQRLYFLQ